MSIKAITSFYERVQIVSEIAFFPLQESKDKKIINSRTNHYNRVKQTLTGKHIQSHLLISRLWVQSKKMKIKNRLQQLQRR
jgi:hypothetical protein